jgi:hypothetical protein
MGWVLVLLDMVFMAVLLVAFVLVFVLLRVIHTDVQHGNELVKEDDAHSKDTVSHRPPSLVRVAPTQKQKKQGQQREIGSGGGSGGGGGLKTLILNAHKNHQTQSAPVSFKYSPTLQAPHPEYLCCWVVCCRLLHVVPVPGRYITHVIYLVPRRVLPVCTLHVYFL